MYGYIRLLKTNTADDAEDYAYYRSIYCSLCHSLECNFGQVPRFLLSYDLTFMVLLADALTPYPSESQECQARERRCLTRFGKLTPVFANCAYLDYAANVSLLLAEQKLLDDKLDKEHLGRRFVSQLLFKQAFNTASLNYPSLSQNIACKMQAFNEVESRLKAKEFSKLCTNNLASSFINANCAQQIANCLQELTNLQPYDLLAGQAFAEVLAEIFRNLPLSANIIQRPGPTPIFTNESLSKLGDCLGVIGAYLGVWLYLIDALSDLSNDIFNNKFNILLVGMPENTLIKLRGHIKHIPLWQRQKWQAQSFSWRDRASLTTLEKTIYDLLKTAHASIQSLQNLVDDSMSLLPYQRSARLLAKIIQLGLSSSLEHNYVRQAYLFNLLKEEDTPRHATTN